MSASPEINQRDLRNRSKEIMDAVEHGQSFMVTRDGHAIAELIPLRRKPRFVSNAAFTAGATALPTVDPNRFRADLDLFDDAFTDPFLDAHGRA